MRVLVIGAGVLGTVYAANLALAGQDVTVFRLWQRLPQRGIEWSFGRFLDSSSWELGTSQINSMRDEVEVISEELLHLATVAGTQVPAFRELIHRRTTLENV